MTIRKSHLKKLIVITSLGMILWGVVAWLFITVPLLVVNALPDLLPLSVFAFLLFLAGLLFLTFVAASIVRIIAPRYTWTVFLAASSLIVLYNLSPLAPVWNCFGKRLYAATANAAGQNCTETCTDNEIKPCGGWSSCWNKDISCSASGIDQDGRPCQGCCFACDVVCEPEEDPDQPPTITANVSCSRFGNNGWCTGTSTLKLTASDPQGYALTISGSVAGAPFTCAQGNTCSRNLPNGKGTINYTVTASQSGKSSNGSTTWKRDATPPTVTPDIPSGPGSNGWFNITPLIVSATGADAISGLLSAQLSVDSGAWKSSVSITTEGVYIVDFMAVDKAGNTATTTRIISVDTTPPSFFTSTSGAAGNAGWYISNTSTSVSSNDALSGVDHIEFNQNGAGWQNGLPFISSDGENTITIRVYDVAGNIANGSLTLKVDTLPPVITPSMSGITGSNGWLVSPGTVSAIMNDVTSGVTGDIEVSFDGGSSWQSIPITLADGVYNMIFRAFDTAGNAGMATFNTSIDTSAPSLGFVLGGTPGENGWYVSDVAVSADASDALSGLDDYAVRANGGDWSTMHTLSDGIHDLEARATDKAGNEESIVGSLRVDTRPPSSIINSHAHGDVVSGRVTLGGTSSDAMSGVSLVEISLDGGALWQRADLSNEVWSYIWNTSRLANGTYVVQIRATDTAGNQEKSKIMKLVAANFPPTVKVTDSWWIWESGEFKVFKNVFAIAEIKVTIRDPQNRWKPVIFTYDPNTTASEVIWDRRFGEVLAPSGNYQVTILACDIYENCASDQGVIHIPNVAPVQPSPTAFVEPASLPTETVLSAMTKTPSQVQPTQTPLDVEVSEQERAIPLRKGLSNHPSWVIAFIAVLVFIFGTTAILDPRPKALRSLAKTIDQFNTQKSIHDKE